VSHELEDPRDHDVHSLRIPDILIVVCISVQDVEKGVLALVLTRLFEICVAEVGSGDILDDFVKSFLPSVSVSETSI